jgi:hypothetical protein
MTHPVYTREELDSVKVVRAPRETVSDKLAAALVIFARWGFDVVTRYKHASPEAAREALKKAGKTDLVSCAWTRARGVTLVLTVLHCSRLRFSGRKGFS